MPNENMPESFRIMDLYKKALHLAFLSFALLFLIFNSGQIERMLRSITSLSVGTIKIELQQLTIEGKQNYGEWATYSRVNEGLQVIDSKFTNGGGEYIDFLATQNLDLSNAYIGDTSRVYQLQGDLFLYQGECIHIKIEEKPQEELPPETECRETFVKLLDETEEIKGIFKADPGEGDRLVIMSQHRGPILDFDYWIVSTGR